MAGIAVFEAAGSWVEQSVKKRYEFAERAAFGKTSIQCSDGLTGRRIRFTQHLHLRLQARHEESGRQSLAGHIAHHYGEAAVLVRNEIEIIATHRAARKIEPGQLPAIVGGRLGRQQRALDLASLMQIGFHELL